jgi:hypothetical protein
VSTGKNLELNPTITAVHGAERESFPEGGFTTTTEDAEPGITATWGITPNIVLSGTVKPDFSQVEADALQLDINQPFALYYPERRPFFVEGADYFDTYENIVHTRTIRDPVWGAKLTGKEGANTFAGYVVQDDITNLVFPSSQYSSATSIEMDSLATVLRFKRDIGSKYTVGALFTDREGDDYFNRVGGFDLELRPTSKDIIQIQALGSATRYPGQIAVDYEQPEDEFRDSLLSLSYAHRTRTITWTAGYENVGPDFRADLGFIPRVGHRTMRGGVNYAWNAPPNRWWSLIRIGTGYNSMDDHNGALLSETKTVYGMFEGALQSWVLLIGRDGKRSYEGRQFDTSELRLTTSLRPTKWFGTSVQVSMNDHIDYANVQPADRVQIGGDASFNVGKKFRLSLGHTLEQLDVAGGRLYTANISQLSSVYQFTTRTFVRTILQMVDYRRDPGLYIEKVDSKFERFASQILFAYKINARTVLYVGYNDNYYAGNDYDLTQADRTVFTKIGYAWAL